MNKNLNYIKETIKTGINEFKSGTKKMFKEFFDEETNKKQRANMWSFSRLIIPIITIITSTIAIITASYPLFAITGCIAGFGAITDYFDGSSSRKHESQSQYGKVLDQITDKFFAGIVGINLLFINFNYIFSLLGELLIATVNVGFKLKYNDLDITSTRIGKIKTWPLYISLALGFLSPINPTLLAVSNISIVITSLFQVLTSISYIDSNSKEVKKLEREKLRSQIEDISNEENEKTKELTLEKENTATKLEQYRKLRNVLNEIIKLKDNSKEFELENFQKRKRRKDK